jgi:hypothetical protein
VVGGPTTDQPRQAIDAPNATTRQEFGPLVSLIAEKIGDLTDCVMLPLFDRMRAYAAHNQAAGQLLEALSDSESIRISGVAGSCRC